MAHFAQIDENNKVINVIVVNNAELIDDNGFESEQKGIDFCTNIFGGTWKQTSYNGSIRKNFAGIGMTYDSVRDAFIDASPYPSWVFNETTCRYESPNPYPYNTEDKFYEWDEGIQDWALVVLP